LEELDNEKRKDDVKESITFENHNGAVTNPVLLRALVNNYVIHGFAIPFLLDKRSKN
jgi:hypothetical protein